LKKLDILGVTIDNVSKKESIAEIERAIELNKRIRIITANPEILYRAGYEPEIRKIINQADLVLPDGVGIVWAGRKLGTYIQERVTGVDLAVEIMKVGNEKGWKLFLLGAAPGVAEGAAIRQQREFPKVKFGWNDGYFSKSEEVSVIKKIADFNPDILFVGLGAPAQEYWLTENSGLARVSMGVGGTIDVLAGKVKRAPKWIQSVGIEWLYRLIKEPTRLKRQKVLPFYVMEVLKQKKRLEGRKPNK